MGTEPLSYATPRGGRRRALLWIVALLAVGFLVLVAVFFLWVLLTPFPGPP